MKMLTVVNGVLFFLMLFAINCEKSVEPNQEQDELSPEQIVTIGDVYFTEGVDADHDGYFSYAKLNIELSLNEGSKDICIQVSYSHKDSAVYYPYQQIKSFILEDHMKPTMSIGLPNSELSQGKWDFEVRVFNSEEDTVGLASVSAGEDNDLHDVPFEPSARDVEITVSDVRWAEKIDHDEDGYLSSGILCLDMNTTEGQAEIFFILYRKGTTDPGYTPVDTSDNFIVEGNTDTDSYCVEISASEKKEYEFAYGIYFSAGNELIRTYSGFDDNDLFEKLEPANQDYIPIGTWLKLDDGTFESWVNFPAGTGDFAVKFYAPSNTLSCRIKKIAIRIDSESNYGMLKVWRIIQGAPNDEIWSGSDLVLLTTGWNEFEVNIDISSFKEFSAGYWQAQAGGPNLSTDTGAFNLGTSFSRSDDVWTQVSGIDYAIEVYVEYTKEPIGPTAVIGSWLKDNKP